MKLGLTNAAILRLSKIAQEEDPRITLINKADIIKESHKYGEQRVNQEIDKDWAMKLVTKLDIPIENFEMIDASSWSSSGLILYISHTVRSKE